MTHPRGVALVEVVVALILVAGAWLALLALQSASLRWVAQGALHEEARWTLQALADSLDRFGVDAGRAELSWGSVEWSAVDGGWLLRAAAHDDRSLAELWSRGGSGSP